MFFFNQPKAPLSPVTGMYAYDVIQYYNSNAYIEYVGTLVVATEQHRDCEIDQRSYTLVYYSTIDGRHAQAFCHVNPHDYSRPNAGYDYTKCHCKEDGNICLGNRKHTGDVYLSEYSLEEAILKARYWCTAFSYMVEHGNFPQPKGGV